MILKRLLASYWDQRSMNSQFVRFYFFKSFKFTDCLQDNSSLRADVDLEWRYSE